MGVTPRLLGALSQLKRRFLQLQNVAARQSSNISFTSFRPQGVSGVILIAESHFSVHTWPENNFVAVDIYTSGEVMKPDIAIAFLQDAFNAQRVEVFRVTRGQIEAGAVQDDE